MKAKKVLSIIFNSINMVLMLMLLACGVCATLQVSNVVKDVALTNTLSNYFNEISNGLIVGVSSLGVSVGTINKLVFIITPLAIVFLSFLFSLIILIKVSKNKRCLFSLIYKVIVESLSLIVLGYVIYVRLSNGMKINNIIIVIACEAIVLLSLVFNFITMSGMPEKRKKNKKQDLNAQANTNAGMNQGVQLNGGFSQMNSYTTPIQNTNFTAPTGYSFNSNQTSSFESQSPSSFPNSATNLSDSSGLYNSSQQTSSSFASSTDSNFGYQNSTTQTANTGYFQSGSASGLETQSSFGTSSFAEGNIDIPATANFESGSQSQGLTDSNNSYTTPSQSSTSTDEFGIPAINQDNLNATTTSQNSNPYGTGDNGNNN